MFPDLKQPIRTATGVTLASLTAAAVVAIAPPQRTWVPLVFSVVLIAVARRFGQAAGILSTLVAGAIFATWMFAPLGTLEVQNLSARTNLAWMVMAAISVSFLLVPPSSRKSRKH